MPELPEVETIRRGLAPLLTGRRIARVEVRHRGLRWSVPPDFEGSVAGRRVHRVERRGKYLLLACDGGTLIVHLGMSGSLRWLRPGVPLAKHDHLDLELDDGNVLRFHDPRRFGSVHWVEGEVMAHPLLAALGPEPLAPGFDGDHLHAAARRRRAAIKQVLMDSHLIAGIGNIYANEALFRAGIHPGRAAHRISRERYGRLAAAICDTLQRALAAGGSSLRDYVDATGEPGYFQQQYDVYGREGQPCRVCAAPIRMLRQGQRSSFYCPRCQR